VGRALRFFATAIVLGISYPNIRFAMCIESFHTIFHDMLGNKPLPPMTEWVIHFQMTMILLAFVIPLAAVLAALFGNLTRFLYTSGVLVLLAIAELVFVYQALYTPFSMVIQGMSGSP
jgi:hypothetical protein